MQSLILAASAVLAGAVAIGADRGQRRWPFYVAKPLATILILTAGLLGAAELAVDPYGRGVLVAGAFCLLGDLLLMGHGSRWFLGGLVAFLVAHLLFILAFRAGGPYDPPNWSLAVAASGIVAAAALARRAGRLHLAVAVYAATLLAMVVCAAARDAALASSLTRGALLGAGLFAISDSLLAWRRFVRPFPGGQALTLSTYWLALWLIVRSTGPLAA